MFNEEQMTNIIFNNSNFSRNRDQDVCHKSKYRSTSNKIMNTFLPKVYGVLIQLLSFRLSAKTYL